MIQIKQENQVWINFFMLVLSCTIGCTFDEDSIYGQWQVSGKSLTIKDDFSFITEANPGVLEHKLLGLFPGGLKEGDQISISEKGEIFINSDVVYSYKKSDTLLYISNIDAVYPLEYELIGREMVLKRETYQGVVTWILTRE